MQRGNNQQPIAPTFSWHLGDNCQGEGICTWTGCSAPSDSVFRALCTNSLTYLLTYREVSEVSSLGKNVCWLFGGIFSRGRNFHGETYDGIVHSGCPDPHAGLFISLYIQRFIISYTLVNKQTHTETGFGRYTTRPTIACD